MSHRRRKKLIITVHGIRTFGQWQERLEELVNDSASDTEDIRFLHYKYGYFSVFAFLIPPLRWLVTRRFRRYANVVCQEEEWDSISVVAHSFGTHIVSWGLKYADQDVRVRNLILAGSVLKSDFDWQSMLGHRVDRLTNDCGTKDSILLLSQLFVLLTGMAGRVGFTGMVGHKFRNRFFEIGHSGYFEAGGRPNDQFMSRYWVPVLLDSPSVEHVDERKSSVTQGVTTFLLNNAEPIKMLTYMTPVVLAFLWIGGLYKNADDSRIAAEAATKIAQANESRLLAANSIDRSNLGDRASAISLAIQALPSTSQPDRPWLPVAERALYRALTSFDSPTDYLSEKSVTAMGMSTDRAAVFATTEDGGLYSYNAYSGSLENVLKDACFHDTFPKVALSGHIYACVDFDNVRIFDASTRELIETISAPFDLSGIALSPHGSYLLLHGLDNKSPAILHRISTLTARKLQTTAAVSRVAFSANEEYLALHLEDGSVAVVRTSEASISPTFSGINNFLVETYVSDDGNFVVQKGNDRFLAFDIGTNSTVLDFKLPGLLAEMYYDGHRRVYVTKEEHELGSPTRFVMYELGTKRQLPAECRCIPVATLGDYIVTSDLSGNISLRTESLLDVVRTLGRAQRPSEFWLTDDGSDVLISMYQQNAMRLPVTGSVARETTLVDSDSELVSSVEVLRESGLAAVQFLNIESASPIMRFIDLSTDDLLIRGEVNYDSRSGGAQILLTSDERYAVFEFHEDWSGMDMGADFFVVDLASGQKIFSDDISGKMSIPKGSTSLAYLTDDSGRVRVLNIGSDVPQQTIELGLRAQSVAYSQATAAVFVVYSNGEIGVFRNGDEEPLAAQPAEFDVDSVHIDPTGSRVLLVGYFGELLLLDSVTLQPLASAGLQAFTASSAVQTANEIQGEIYSWDFEETPGGYLIFDPESDRSLEILLDTESSEFLAINGRGTTVSLATESGRIEIWNAVTQEQLASFQSGIDRVTAIDVTSDGQLIAFGDDEGNVYLWTTGDDAPRLLAEHLGTITSISCGKDGSVVAAVAEYDDIRVWNTKSGKVLAEFTNDHELFDRLVVDEDQNSLIAIWTDLMVSASLYDFADPGNPISVNEGQRVVRDVVFHEDAVTIYLSSGEVMAWSPFSSAKPQRALPNSYLALSDPDDENWAIRQDSASRVFVYDKATGDETELTREDDGFSQIKSVAFNKDGTAVLVTFTTNEIELWRTRPYSRVLELNEYLGPVTGALFSDSGDSIVVVYDEGVARVWPYYADTKALISAAQSELNGRSVTDVR